MDCLPAMHRRNAVETLFGLAAVALLTLVADRLGIRSEPAAALYLFVVLAMSLRGSIVAALVTAIASTLSWDLVLTAPSTPLFQREIRDVITLIAFGATAVVIVRLVTAVRASEDRWKNVFENNPVMYFIVDPSGVVLSVNRHAARQLGYEVDELVGRSVLNVVAEADKAAARDYLSQCLTRLGESRSRELRKVRKDGTSLWLRETARAVQLGKQPPVVLIACEDITENKRAELERRRSEAYLAEAQRLSHTGSFGWKPSDGTIVWSDETYRIFEYDRSMRPTVDLVLERTHPDDRAALQSRVESLSNAASDFVFENRLLMPDGSIRHIGVVAHAVSDPSGQPELIGAVMDITAEKEAERERRARRWFLESMDRVNRAIQGTEDMGGMMADVLEVVLAIFDCDTVDLCYPCDPDAPSYRVIMRVDREAGASAGVGEIAVDEDMARVLRHVRASTGPVRFDPESGYTLPASAAEFGTRSGLAMALHPRMDAPHVIWLHQVSHARVWNPLEEELFEEIGWRLTDALSMLIVVRDLQESTRRYRNIFQMANVSIWEQDFTLVKAAIEELRASGVSDFDRYFSEHPEFVARALKLLRFLDVNDATLRMFGGSSKDQLVASLDRIVTPDSLQDFAGLLLVLAEGRSTHTGEASYRTLQGERVDALATVAFPPDPANLDRVMVSFMDITARRRAEEELRLAQAELTRASTLTTMGQLAGSIAHELRQPLAAIAMNGSAALRWLGRDKPELDEARAAARSIVRDAKRADEVIRGLRALIGQSELRREPVDVNAAIQEVIALARGELRRTGTVAQTIFSPSLSRALGDRVQLQQVVLNLVLNAIEVMTQTPIALKAIVVRTASTESGDVAVVVEDSGPGFDPAHADRMFDPFFTTKPSGLGLGLSICRSIVEAHGGRLSAAPRLPCGATFRFTIPSAERTPDATSGYGSLTSV
jgi:PAS domain S-box-containing protein